MTRNDKIKIALKTVSKALKGMPLSDTLLVARTIAGYSIDANCDDAHRLPLFVQFMQQLAGDLDITVKSEDGDDNIHIHPVQ